MIKQHNEPIKVLTIIEDNHITGVVYGTIEIKPTSYLPNVKEQYQQMQNYKNNTATNKRTKQK